MLSSHRHHFAFISEAIPYQLPLLPLYLSVYTRQNISHSIAPTNAHLIGTMPPKPQSSPSVFPHLQTYHIGRGETGVLTYEPYKSALLPLWRFRTVPIAQDSSAALWERFLAYYAAHDFVGMDMSRKFIQMGMTRAKRYANYKGGRKYVKREVEGTDEEESRSEKRARQMDKSGGHEGKEEKEEASRVFREVWERCKAHEGYQKLKEEFLAAQKEWEKGERRVAKRKVKEETGQEEVDDSPEPKRKSKRR